MPELFLKEVCLRDDGEPWSQGVEPQLGNVNAVDGNGTRHRLYYSEQRQGQGGFPRPSSAHYTHFLST